MMLEDINRLIFNLCSFHMECQTSHLYQFLIHSKVWLRLLRENLFNQSYNIKISSKSMASKSLSKAFNMIMFRGKLTVSPNTLNNEIHTYFFADYWQKMHTQTEFLRQSNENKQKMKKMMNPSYKQDNVKQAESQYSSKKWMELIKNVAEFNRFYVQCYKETSKQESFNIMDFRAFKLFHDWDVWGDSTSYPELKATAVFDASRDDPIVLLDDDMHLSSKMGTNKCIIANMDTDSQDMSKLFAFTLNLNQQLKLHLNPSVCRSIYIRTVDALPWTPSMGVHWFGGGNTDVLHGNIDPSLIKWPLNKFYDQALKQNLTQMRMLQYRYNHPSKVSSVVGFLMNTEGSQEYRFINYNWRIVSIQSQKYLNPSPSKQYNGFSNEETTAQIFFRNVQYGSNKNGVLVDVSAAVMDANSKDFLPFFPHRFKITISSKDSGKQFCYRDIDNRQQIMELFHKRAGLLLFQNVTIPNQPVNINIYEIIYSNVATIEDIEVKFNGSEEQYVLQFKDHFLKTQPIKTQQKTLDKTQQGIVNSSDLDDKSKVVKIYNNYVQYTLCCTKYGKLYDGKQTLTLRSKFQIDSGALPQYTTNEKYLEQKLPSKCQQEYLNPKQRIEKLIAKSQKFRNTFKSYDEVNRLVYQNKLQDIIQLTNNYITKLHCEGKLQYTFTQQNDNKRRPFQLSFAPNQQNCKQDVIFVNGIAKVRIYLNKDLTEFNNPRNPALESLCIQGELKIVKDIKENSQIDPNFTALFFQNPIKNPYEKIDWLNVVGPKLKRMGLIYPSMQNIVNLYEYDGLSMNAMRRAFEIQDQNHSRYMPATRQMSPSTHRQIRRWLFNPIYDYKIHSATLSPSAKKKKPLSFKTFDQGKAQLITLLKEAFKLELTTIPLYLSAMFSISTQGEETKLIRSVAKDEMKHLFIVSNILNALGEAPPFPQRDQKINKNVPEFPVLTQTELICFRFQCQQNQKWKQFMNPLPIQSSIRQQLLRFILIQMPGQAYEIQLSPTLINPQDKSEFQLNKQACTCGGSYSNCPKKTKMCERACRINSIKEVIDAVVREMTSPPENSKEQFMTIGMAYEKISDYLWALNDMDQKRLFSGDNARQFTYMYLDTMCNVIDLRTALEQIRLITEEGEGSSMFTVTGKTNKSSHFIKFIQIFTGCDLEILSEYSTVGTGQEKSLKRSAKFVFTPNDQRFPNFPNYTKVCWTKQVDDIVDEKVNSQLALQRLSDNLRFTQFPNTYAPRSFLNNYVKILEELGFIFTTDPKTFKSNHGLTFDEARLKNLENAVARMRQMTLNATHIVHPNDTFDRKYPKPPSQDRPNYPDSQTSPPKRYPSASPKYNIQDSQWIPQQDSPLKPEKSGKK